MNDEQVNLELQGILDRKERIIKFIEKMQSFRKSLAIKRGDGRPIICDSELKYQDELERLKILEKEAQKG
jgi:hypothetical protein